VALRALDIAAEVIAEMPYMALAGWVLWGWWRAAGRCPRPRAAGMIGGACWPCRCWPMSGGACGAKRHHRRFIQDPHRAPPAAEIHLMRRELARQRTGMPLAIILHFFAWSMAGLQVYIAAHIFGMNLSLYAAFAIESAATAARMILFSCRAALSCRRQAQCWRAGGGHRPGDGAGVSLVLRLRDVALARACCSGRAGIQARPNGQTHCEAAFAIRRHEVGTCVAHRIKGGADRAVVAAPQAKLTFMRNFAPTPGLRDPFARRDQEAKGPTRCRPPRIVESGDSGGIGRPALIAATSASRFCR
jgi:hypothetical protein